MSLESGVIKIAVGHYIYKGWDLRLLRKNKWRGTKLGKAITLETLAEVCSMIRIQEELIADNERKSI